jgi:type VI secretion system protein ImpK
MSDNPFLEPEFDSDRTIIRPQPGGRGRPPAEPAAGRAAPPAPPQAPPPKAPPPQAPLVRPPAEAPPAADALPAIASSANVLVAAATPLLQLLARLRNTATPPFSGDLRERAAGALQGFEQRARAAGVPTEQVRAAHRALCASLDDVVLNTPWGSSAGTWAAAPLTAAFHRDARFQEVRDEDWFFDQLARMQRNPAGWLPVLELMYLCLSLGFMGHCRQTTDGAAELERVRAATHAAIARQRKPAGEELSLHWTGVAAPYRPGRAGLPVWVAGSAALAAVVAVFVWCAIGLGAASDDAYARMLAAPPATMPTILRATMVRPPPPPPEPPAPGLADRLRTVLRSDIDQHLVGIVSNASTTVLRLGTGGMFAAAGATLQPAALPLLKRVGTALGGVLAGEPANEVRVIGYTDDQPVRTLRFPSNFELSSARAQAVREALGRAAGNTLRLAAEGRADADPVAANATAEGREQNRRIEIVLQSPP